MHILLVRGMLWEQGEVIVLNLKKYIIRYDALYPVILDENNDELFKVTTGHPSILLYKKGDETKPLFYIKKTGSKFGVFKGRIIFGVFDEHNSSIGEIECESPLQYMEAAKILNQNKQESGKFVYAKYGMYYYIIDNKTIGILYKNEPKGSCYLLDLSKADSSIDRRIALSFSLLAIKADENKSFLIQGATAYLLHKKFHYRNSQEISWDLNGQNKKPKICPKCLKTYDNSWDVCLSCSTPLKKNE